MPESDYPPDWHQISKAIRERAGGRCECTGECGLHRGNRCVERDLEPAKYASGTVVLTVAHRNHSAADCRPENLIAACNTCHLRYDAVLHMEHAWRKRRARKAIGDLFEDDPHAAHLAAELEEQQCTD